MFRLKRGGVARLSGTIEVDLRGRETGLESRNIKALSDICAGVLHCRSVNTSEISAVLPRASKNDDSRYRVINRFLANGRVDVVQVMGGFVPQLLKLAGGGGKTCVLMLDQSKISDGFECLMVSLRLRERAVPLLFKTIRTQGSIGVDIQRQLLDELATMLPPGVAIMLGADRFYGTAALISYCQAQGWAYRIRLKSNLILTHEGGELMTGDIPKLVPEGVENAELSGSGVTTSIAALHEKGHPEPWLIAMDGKPTKARARDYGMRWGIEALFSDFKSRGFAITDTHLLHAERIDRLIMVLAIATFHAVSTAMQPDPNEPQYTPKKPVAA